MAKTKDVARFKMTFPPNVMGEPFMYKLSKEMKVVPNILRGRIADTNAWLEIEIAGSKANINKAIKFLEEKGVAITQLKS